MPPLVRLTAASAVLLGCASAATLEDASLKVLTFGPRVTGTPASQQARALLEREFRSLGYQTRNERFTYAKVSDLGSAVRVGGASVPGHAMQGSGSSEVTAPAVRVPGGGGAEDFAQVDVRGKVAVTQRGQVQFGDMAREAQARGAVGLIIINQLPGELRGNLGRAVTLPVLGVSQETGARLTSGTRVTLTVRVQEREVTGFNLVAFKAGVTRPDLLFGAHLDSVPGAPGANDNLSGALTVLELARRTANDPLSARSFFALFDGEEDGLRGSRAFVKANGPLVAGLRGMLNFDMVGIDARPLLISGEGKLLDWGRTALGDAVTEGRSNDSDHAAFREAGVSTLMFHRGLDANYHRPGDTLLDPALIRATADAALAIAAQVSVPATAR